MSLRCAYIDHGRAARPTSCAGRREMEAAGRQVLIEVAYAGVNRPDVLQRSGSYPPPPGASPHLGLEVSGTVIATGPQASRWRVGDRLRVDARRRLRAILPADERHCLPVPRGMDLLTAAAIPENYYTVWTNVFERARLAAGERFRCTAAPAASA